MLVVLHDLNLAALLGDRLIWLGPAGIERHGCPQDILTREFLEATYGACFQPIRDPGSGRRFVIPVLDPTVSPSDRA